MALSWYDPWSVDVDPATKLYFPSYSGSSAEAAPVRPKLHGANLEALGDFSIGVIYGESGSGKSQLLMELRAALSKNGQAAADGGQAEMLSLRAALEDSRTKAVVSLVEESLGESAEVGAGVDRLGSVGLNNIKAWLRPFPCLSNGQQSRVLNGMVIASDCFLDDFATVVDKVQAASMASALQKLVRSSGFRRVLISTTHAIAAHFLQPEFLVLASSGEIILRPAGSSSSSSATAAAPRRRVELDWALHMGTFPESTYPPAASGDLAWKPSGEPGADDEAEADISDIINEDATQTSWLDKKIFEQYRLVTGPSCVQTHTKRATVAVDAATTKAANAFEMKFTGTTETEIYVPNVNAHDFFRDLSGAVVGPSGSGKTTALREVVARELQRPGRTVIEPTAEEQKTGAQGDWPRRKTILCVVTEAVAGGGSSSASSSCGGLSPLTETPSSIPLEERVMIASEVLSACGCTGDLLKKPYHVLASSEQHACVVARLLARARGVSQSGLVTVVIDEFTSSMDRRRGLEFAGGIRDYLQSEACRGKIRLVVASLFSDIVPALRPSWCLDSFSGMVLRSRQGPSRGVGHSCGSTALQLNRRTVETYILKAPRIALEVRRIPKAHVDAVWYKKFAEHHYLADNSLPSCKRGAFLVRVQQGRRAEKSAGGSRPQRDLQQSGVLPAATTEEDPDQGVLDSISLPPVPVAIHITSNLHNPLYYRFIRESRIVTLPEFQGHGVGVKVSETVGQAYFARKWKFSSQTSHPRLGGYRDSAPGKRFWRPNTANGAKAVNPMLSQIKQELWRAKKSGDASKIQKCEQKLENALGSVEGELNEERRKFTHHYWGGDEAAYQDCVNYWAAMDEQAEAGRKGKKAAVARVGAPGGSAASAAASPSLARASSSAPAAAPKKRGRPPKIRSSDAAPAAVAPPPSAASSSAGPGPFSNGGAAASASAPVGPAFDTSDATADAFLLDDLFDDFDDDLPKPPTSKPNNDLTNRPFFPPENDGGADADDGETETELVDTLMAVCGQDVRRFWDEEKVGELLERVRAQHPGWDANLIFNKVHEEMEEEASRRVAAELSSASAGAASSSRPVPGAGVGAAGRGPPGRVRLSFAQQDFGGGVGSRSSAEAFFGGAASSSGPRDDDVVVLEDDSPVPKRRRTEEDAARSQALQSLKNFCASAGLVTKSEWELQGALEENDWDQERAIEALLME